ERGVIAQVLDQVGEQRAGLAGVGEVARRRRYGLSRREDMAHGGAGLLREGIGIGGGGAGGGEGGSPGGGGVWGGGALLACVAAPSQGGAARRQAEAAGLAVAPWLSGGHALSRRQRTGARERGMKIGLFITNQQKVGTDMVQALGDQITMVHHARDRGWDS